MMFVAVLTSVLLLSGVLVGSAAYGSISTDKARIKVMTHGYTIEKFVWEPIDDPAFMSTPMSSVITIS